MPTLSQSLLNCDLGRLRIVAELWGVEMATPDSHSALPLLSKNLLEAGLVAEIVESLPAEAAAALGALQQNGGRLPWPQFIRRFGVVREMGPGRRDRERPDRDPASPAEILWYRALVARAFFDTSRGTEEFAYIPSDLLPLLPRLPSAEPPQREISSQPLGRAATPAERACPTPASDHILDQACTLLAASRTGIAPAPVNPYTPGFLHALLTIAGLLDSHGLPTPDATRAFLESPRGPALILLARAWLISPDHNDLRHVPHLQPEGEWANDPLTARRFMLRLLSHLPAGTWWSLSAFVADVRQQHPDFQRPAGDYDSWFLRDERTGEFLRGFEHWEEVDGALIRYLISGPLHYLGIVDLASPEAEDSPVGAFRYSGWAANLLKGAPPEGLPEEAARVHLRSDGRVSVPLLAPRAIRYQLARFCQWEDDSPHEYRYRLTPASLNCAREQGLRVGHLLSLLSHHADAIPPHLLTALTRWDEHGTEVRLKEALVLRLGSPQILQALRSSRAARFLGDPLGPATVIVKPGAGEKVLAILTEMGYLGEFGE